MQTMQFLWLWAFVKLYLNDINHYPAGGVFSVALTRYVRPSANGTVRQRRCCVCLSPRHSTTPVTGLLLLRRFLRRRRRRRGRWVISRTFCAPVVCAQYLGGGGRTAKWVCELHKNDKRRAPWVRSIFHSTHSCRRLRLSQVLPRRTIVLTLHPFQCVFCLQLEPVD